MQYVIDLSTHSPNYTPRGKHAIGMIVLHATVGSYASALAWLCNPKSGVSTHYLIRKDGHIAQIVANSFIAWHAGRASWHGKIDINDRSIGIELENANDGRDPYPTAQLDALLWLARGLVTKYTISKEMVVRHLDIAIPKGRKTDPAGFPWPWFITELYGSGGNTMQTYRVKSSTQIGATVRASTEANNGKPIGERLFSIPAGERLTGRIVSGGGVVLAGFPPSSEWIELEPGGFVWAPLCEVVS